MMQRRRPRRWLSSRFVQHVCILSGVALFCVLGSVVAFSTGVSEAGSPPVVVATAPAPAVPAPVASEPQPEPEPEPVLHVTEGEIDRGESLGRVLGEEGVAPDVVHLIAHEMATYVDFRRAQPGHSFRLVQDDGGRPVDFRYRTSPIESWHLLHEEGRWVVRHEEVDLTPQVALVAGVVTSSLYTALTDLGEEPQLAADFTDIFAWDVDFSRSVQPGDEFRILYERLYRTDESGAEVYVRPGHILAARYEGTAGSHTALYFESETGRGGYYHPDGSSVQRQFLVAPLRYSRISSRFTSARFHPILNITRPHHGIDYAAPTGTPIWAVADGEVIYRSRAGGFGNLVKIRHRNGYVSYYAHMSRFANGLRVGQTVRQKQVVGYVGQTGLATGPHVCFRVAKNGRYVNPASVRSPGGEPVSPEVLPVFASSRDRLLAELDSGPLLATEEAL